VSHWAFIIASYGVALIGTFALTWLSFRDMRRAEAAAAAMKDER
jgi:hypothetical protein